ncbi:MAG: tripartite tricarboxylate transporter TctB family protein [Alphaproteobacteria bacterium]|nr:tripartite tricarboxylate transporter TctB family protein [Alphaproteobacteria bacterium]
MTRGGRDTLSGAVLLLGSLALLIALPGQIETLEGPDLTPAFIPRLMIIAIGGLSGILLAQGVLALRREGASGPAVDPTTRLRGAGAVLALVAVVILQILLMTRLGYLGSTALAVGALALLYGHRRWWHILILMVVAPPAIMLFFRHLMLVLLPPGSWLE